MAAGTIFDDFDQGALPSPWTAVTSGEGVVSMTDSCIKLGFTAGATNDGCAVVAPFDRSLGNYQRVEFVLASAIVAPVFRPSLRLLASTGTPGNDTRPNLNAKTALWFYQNDVAGVRAGQLQYYNTSNVAQSWTNSSMTWNTGAQNSTPTITNPNFHSLGFDWDELNGRVRMFQKHASTGSGFANDVGFKLMALTDWVNFTGIQNLGSNNLWFVLGFLENTLASFGTTEALLVERYVQEYADSYDEMWGNQKSAAAGTYSIKHWRKLSGAQGAKGYIWLPESRTGITINSGSPAWKSNSTQFGGCYNDSGYVMSFSGNSGAKNSLGLATSATAQDGSWTEHASNPILAPSAGTDQGNFGMNVMFPDYTDIASRRYKWLVTCQSDIDNLFRVCLYYAANYDGPYTLDGVVLDQHASDGNTGVQLYAAPIWWNGVWYLFYVGTDNTNQWQNFVATGTSMAAGAFTKDRSFDFTPNGIEMTVTTGTPTGVQQTVNSTTGLVKNALIVYDNDATNTTWTIEQVRKVPSGTVFETYASMPGVSAAAGAFRTVDRGKKYFHWIEKQGSEWVFWGTAFGVFYQHATYNANYEGGACWTSASLTGAAKAIDWLRSPGILLGRDNNGGSSENPRGVMAPFLPGAALAGGLTVALTNSASLGVPKPLAAALAVALTDTSALDVPKPLASALALAITQASDLTTSSSGAALAAALALAFSESADLAVPKPLAAALALAFTDSGDLVIAKPLAAALALAFTDSADLSTSSAGAALAAALTVALTETAAVTVPKPLAADLALALTESAALTVPKPLAAALALSIVDGADLTTPGAAAALAASLAVSLGVSADLVVFLLRRLVAGTHLAPAFERTDTPRVAPALTGAIDLPPS